MDPVVPGQASPAVPAGVPPVFSPGQVLSARVIEAVAANTYLVAVRGMTLIAASESPLAADSVVRLVVQGGGGEGPVRVALAPASEVPVASFPAEPTASADDPKTVAARLGLPPGPLSEQVVAAFQRQGAPLTPDVLRQAVRLLSAAAAQQEDGGDRSPSGSAVRTEDLADVMEILAREVMAGRPPTGRPAVLQLPRTPLQSLSTVLSDGDAEASADGPQSEMLLRSLPTAPATSIASRGGQAPPIQARTDAPPAPMPSVAPRAPPAEEARPVAARPLVAGPPPPRDVPVPAPSPMRAIPGDPVSGADRTVSVPAAKPSAPANAIDPRPIAPVSSAPTAEPSAARPSPVTGFDPEGTMPSAAARGAGPIIAPPTVSAAVRPLGAPPMGNVLPPLAHDPAPIPPTVAGQPPATSASVPETVVAVPPGARAPGIAIRPAEPSPTSGPLAVPSSREAPAAPGPVASRSVPAGQTMTPPQVAGNAALDPAGASRGRPAAMPMAPGTAFPAAPRLPTDPTRTAAPSERDGVVSAERPMLPPRAASAAPTGERVIPSGTGIPPATRGASEMQEVRVPTTRFQRTWSSSAPVLSPAAVRAVAALPPAVAREAVARLAASPLPVVPATIPLAARAVSGVLPRAAALMPEQAAASSLVPARSQVDPAQVGPAAAIHTALQLAGIRPEAAVPMVDVLGDTILLHRLVQLAAGLGPRLAGPAEGTPQSSPGTAVPGEPAQPATAAVARGALAPLPVSDEGAPSTIPAASLPAPDAPRAVEAALVAVREAVAQDLLPPKELADYDRVLALPLADHGRPVPARLAVTTRRTATGGLACWMRVDCELSRLGPVSVRLGSVDAGPVAITLFTTPAAGAALAAGLPALGDDLRALGVDAALRVVEEQPS